jgi:DNA repair protein RadD
MEAVWESLVQEYPFQLEAVARLRAEVGRVLAARLPRRVILQAPTGSGKTVMAGGVIRAAVAKGSRVLFLAATRELITQCSRKLFDFGVPHGLIMAGHGYTPAPVQVASKDTLAVRHGLGRLELPPADLVVVDECHLSLSPGWMRLLSRYEKALVLGLTATPVFGNGKPLGWYQGMVQAAQPSWLIANEYLVPTRCYAPYTPSLKGLGSNGKGDYDARKVERRMNKATLTGDAVAQWHKHAEGRQTIVFCSGVEHSIAVAAAFDRDGVPAEHIDGKTDPEKRAAILGRLSSGQTRVVTNCNVWTAGVDVPVVSCCQLLRPTKSYRLFRQMAGRVQRPHPGKADAVLLDHAGAIGLHGLPDEDVEWSLSGDFRVRHADQPEFKPRVCPKCKAVSTSRTCGACGFAGKEKAREAREVEWLDGELVAVGAPADEYRAFEAHQRLWHKCLAIAANRGLTAGVAASMFIRESKGTKPWEVGGLPNVPAEGDYKKPVAELFPQYARRRA